MINAVSPRGETRIRSPGWIMPVSTLPDTQNPDPNPLNISFIDILNGLVIGLSGVLNPSGKVEALVITI